MIELLGAMGAICFAFSAVPLAIDTIKLGKSDVSLLGIMLIIIGSNSMLLYELLTSVKLFSLINFSVCSLAWSVILKYRVLPRSAKDEKIQRG